MADEGGGGGAPLWMVTFADLMSLLLTLFVLLLTFAEMNVVRYKAMAGSMRDAFGISKKDQLAGVIEMDGSVRRKAAADVVPFKSNIPSVSVDLPTTEDQEEFQLNAKGNEEEQAEQVRQAIQKIVDEELQGLDVAVDREGNEVVIRFPSSVAFPSGTAEVSQQFAAVVDQLAPIIQQTPGQVVVSGHTDNVPVGGGRYNSNWDLSAARATAVIQRLIDYNKVEPNRLTVQGYGESRPLVDNDTPENRAKNRRVEVSIMVTKEVANTFNNQD